MPAPESSCERCPRFPEKILVEGAESAATPAAEGGDDDFFSSWDKPAVKPSPAASSKPASPPVLGKSASAGNAPRTVSSASLRSTSTSSLSSSKPASKLGASRLNSASSITSSASAAPKKSKLGGLGAKKAAAPVDFAEAERKAAEEAERIRQLGYDREREKAEEEERVRVAAEKAAANKAKTSSTATKSTPVASSASASVATPKGNAQDMERLGMGFKRLGFGAVPAAAASSRCVSRVDLVENYAEHFRGCPQFASLGGCADLRAR